MIHERFTALGTDVELLVDAEPSDRVRSILADARSETARVETIMSRFRPDSELNRLNRERRLERPSPELATVVMLALEARLATDGRFTPFVHDAVESAGYDRTFAQIAHDGPPSPAGIAVPPTTVISDADGLRLDGEGHLDLGGIAKGYIVELVAEVLAAAGPCLVNAGGDIAVRSTPRDGSGWTVGVPVPNGEMVLALSGSVATSGRDRRAWRRGGRPMHHIIDPATGLPAITDMVRVTAFGPSAVDAEIRATALFLAGSAGAAIAEADDQGIAAIVVDARDRVLVSSSIACARRTSGIAA